MKKIVSLLLCLSLLVIGTGCSFADATFKADGDLELTLAVNCPSGCGPAENMWFWHYISDALNMKLNIIEVQNAGTYRSLSMASGEMPDAFFGCGFSTGELVRYGGEGLILDFKPYIQEMPNLSALLDSRDIERFVTTADGKIYSLFYVQGQQWKGTADKVPMFFDAGLMNELDFAWPETLDELYNLLVAMKEVKADVDGYYPIGGNYNNYLIERYILDCFGYLGTSSSEIAMKNGEPVIPVNDQEGYEQYITFMRKLYEEGLMEADYFTIDDTTVLAKLQNGQYSFIQALHKAANPPENWSEWESAPVVKGELTGTQLWPMAAENIDGIPTSVFIGGYVVNAATEHLEAALKFADWFYGNKGENYYIFWCGETAANIEAQNLYYEGVDFSGWTMNDAGSQVYTTENYNRNVNLVQHVFYGLGDGCNYSTIGQYIAGWNDDLEAIDGDATLNDSSNYDHCAKSTVQYHTPYFAQCYPSVVFFDEATAERVDELKSIIKDHVAAQEAAFIVGHRSLDELPAFFEEVKKLGIDELEKYYVDYYNAVN